MSYLNAWLIVGASVLVAIGLILGEYVWRRMTGRWPPTGHGAGVAGTAAVIAANQGKDSPDDSADSGDTGGDSGGDPGGGD